MKKIINGKRYDTETAELVGEWSNTYNYSDFSYECEELYRKKTGEFFMYGAGGPASSYAVSSGNNNWTGSSKITPLTIEEAKKWAEKNLDADAYEKYFELEEEGNIAFSLLLPENLYNKLKNESEKTGESMKDIIVEALENKLK
nr:MAG TPA_asm: ParG [Caudoviricetes sp.]